MFCILDQTALATWAGAGVMLLVAIIGWGGSALRGFGNIRRSMTLDREEIRQTLTDQNAKMAANHAENKEAMAGLRAGQDHMDTWLHSVSDKTDHIGGILTELVTHEKRLDTLDGRVNKIEIHCAAKGNRCEEDDYASE